MSKVPSYMKVGSSQVLGSHNFTTDAIIRFAEKYDPQPFHLSEEGGKNSLFGGLCASGWHTTAVWMKLFRKHANNIQLEDEDNTGLCPEYGPSPGFSDLRWIKPVYSGDTITYEDTVSNLRESKSKPGWWIQTFNHIARNQKGETVMTFTSSVLVFVSSQSK